MKHEMRQELRAEPQSPALCRDFAVFVCMDGGFLCPDCADGKNGSRAADPDLDKECPDDHQWITIGAQTSTGDTCDHCGKRAGLPDPMTGYHVR